MECMAPERGKDSPFLRYADLLLIYVESQDVADGSPNTVSYKAVDDIRARVGLAPLANGISKGAFKEEV